MLVENDNQNEDITDAAWSSSNVDTSYLLSKPRVQNAIFMQCTPGGQ
jgi:hypothetical protein